MCVILVCLCKQGHVVSWTTPLGLPVMQPYVKRIPHTVKTLLQSITLSIENDALPVSAMKQKSAFPPNYVHSLDSTHMLMTGLKMKERGLSYTAVHDSYWTHACDVDTMNSDLRDCFIELYKKPLLEDLKNSLELRYPNIASPPVPGRGELDIDQVTKSRYFFH
jgi:DNA-directed RNA polymerase